MQSQNIWLCKPTKQLQMRKKSDFHTFWLILWADFHSAQTVVCEVASLVNKRNLCPWQASRSMCFTKSNEVRRFSVRCWWGKEKTGTINIFLLQHVDRLCDFLCLWYNNLHWISVRKKTLLANIWITLQNQYWEQWCWCTFYRTAGKLVAV